MEDKSRCRSWRLKENLVLDGPSQEAVPTPFHRLEWLSIKAGTVSGGRGSARRVMGGFFDGDLPTNDKEEIEIKLKEIKLELAGEKNIDQVCYCR